MCPDYLVSPVKGGRDLLGPTTLGLKKVVENGEKVEGSYQL